MLTFRANSLRTGGPSWSIMIHVVLKPPHRIGTNRNLQRNTDGVDIHLEISVRGAGAQVHLRATRRVPGKQELLLYE
jgi:hypothetical protein